MTSEEFEKLLQRNENETIDFKSAMYVFGGSGEEQKERKAKFLIDILCMWNTPREAPAYIVMGVNKHIDGTYDLIGVDQFVDDANLQQQLHDSVYPVPSVEVNSVTYQAKKFIVIVIPLDRKKGPILPTKDFGGILKRHQVYHRLGSRNSLADQSAQHIIYKWFLQEVPLQPQAGVLGAEWDLFIDKVMEFSTHACYILITDQKENTEKEDLSSLGLIDWSLVIDFDPSSESQGLLLACRDMLNRRRSLHYIVKGDRPILNPKTATYWYFAKGMVGRESTMLKNDRWIDWNSAYSRDINNFIENAAKKITPMPVCCIVLWSKDQQSRYLESVLSSISAAFGDSTTSVIVGTKNNSLAEWYESLKENFNAEYVAMPISHLCNGIRTIKLITEDSSRELMPSSSGVFIEVPKDKLAWLKEEIEVVTMSSGNVCPAGRQAGRDFLRGSEVAWFDLGLTYDVERDITPKLHERVRQALSLRRPYRINLYHAPGAGGTTVAKRIIWNLHRLYPCVLVNSFTSGETIERISYLSGITGQPVLAVVDGGLIIDRDVDALYEQIAARHLSVVMLQVLRSFDPISHLRDRLYLSAQLTDSEASKFVHFLSREEPSRTQTLQSAASSQENHIRTPFYLGLLTFERDFIGIERYVGDKLDKLSDTQSRIIAFLAFAHYYGQQSMPAGIFADILALPRNNHVDLKKHLTRAIDLLVESAPDKWRTAHPIIAETCLKHILKQKNSDPETWKYHLSSWAKDFAACCRGDIQMHPTISEECLNVVRRVFVYRDNTELMGTEKAGRQIFSPFLEHLPSKEAKLEVYRYLTDIFPEEAHFWAHLARLLYIDFKKFPEAEEAIARALNLNPQDHVIHHMRGMIQRGKVYDFIQQRSPIAKVVEAAEIASKSFSEARSFGPDDEHGYISEVQLIIRVLEYARHFHELSTNQIAITSESPKWLREAVQLAEHLLAELRQLRIKERSSEYENNCRANLDIVYGDFNSALQLWDNLLSRKDVYAPPIRRQLVWTYLAKREHDWDALQPKEIKRIHDLLDKNIQEEVGSDKDLRLWLQAIRRVDNPPSLESVIEQVAYWKSVSDSLESVYYLYVLYALQVLGGSDIEVPRMLDYLNQCRDRARYRRQRTWSFEWLGEGTGINGLVHQSKLKKWNEEIDFWTDSHLLKRIGGVVKRIQGPHSAEIELAGGVTAFFVPAKSNHVKGADENRRVSCYIGFSYDGLRAWSIRNE
ncbi:MAG: RNA-binding domain-containing protein [Thermodesulfovibrionales bacterium]